MCHPALLSQPRPACITWTMPSTICPPGSWTKSVHMAVEWGRQTRPDMKVGICGEHGGHPDSIRFCHAIGLSYVSCSGPRVPVARLAAAHAALADVASVAGTRAL